MALQTCCLADECRLLKQFYLAALLAMTDPSLVLNKN